jgi:hypothetical protein
MFTNDLPLLLLLCVYGVVLDFLWDIISYVIYVYILWTTCGRTPCICHCAMLFCLLVGFCLVEPTIIIPPPLLSTPYSLVCILAFLTGIRMAMISEPSQRLHSLRYILLHSFPDQFFLHLVPGINYLFKRNQALSRSLFTNFQTITYAEHKCCSQYEQ